MFKFVCRICGGSEYTPVGAAFRCDTCSAHFSSPESFTLPKVKFIKLDENAIEPNRAKDGDVGYDAISIMDVVIAPRNTVMVKTGISVQLPPNTEMQVRARSGMAKKYGIMVINGPGTIDTGYRGPCNVLLHNTSDIEYVVEKGNAIAQFLVTPKLPYIFTEVDQLDDTDRGSGGFGHTGK